MLRQSSAIYHLLALVLLSVIVTGLVFSVLFKATATNALGSDFVSFLTGASVIRAGKGNQLYDLVTQFSFQQALLAQEISTDFLLPFRNLPFVAFFFLPFLYRYSAVNIFLISCSPCA